MTTIAFYIAAFIVSVGVLVAIHEYGHFLVARLVGIRVLRFSIGFGRPILNLGSDRKGTEYIVSAIPLGGYVKMLDEREGGVAEEDAAMAFNRAPVSSRIAVLLAGPLFNFAFAIVAYWALFVVGVPGVKPLIGEVTADSPAFAAGMQSGDQIMAVGGNDTPTWESALVEILDEMLDDGRIRLTVSNAGGPSRDVSLDVRGREAELTQPGALLDGLGFGRYYPPIAPVLGNIEPGSPASRAGFEPGDRIVDADGRAIGDWNDWVEFIRARPGETVTVTYLRNDATETRQLVIGRFNDEGGEIGRIGVLPQPDPAATDALRAELSYAPARALGAAIDKTWDVSILSLRMFGRMLTGDVSIRNLSGPLRIGQYAGESARIGLETFVGFMALVSISLGILNLLPIPLLDGGQIVFQFAEFVKGRPVSERVELISQQVGILLLVMIMGIAFYNDIVELVG